MYFCQLEYSCRKKCGKNFCMQFKYTSMPSVTQLSSPPIADISIVPVFFFHPSMINMCVCDNTHMLFIIYVMFYMIN